MAAKVSEVSVSYGATRNMGNYESMKVEYRVTRTLEEGDDTATIIRATVVELQKMVNEDVKGVLKRGF